ncbi:unnamed protein product [Schistosoma turkestanicum]|nr:unnamed protein product [Schistosoma turkestanicum]
MDHPIKVRTRNSEICYFTPPFRSEYVSSPSSSSSSSSSSILRDLSKPIKQSEHSINSTNDRRHLRRYQQWHTQAQKPFTPRFFNICKPNFGKDFINSSQSIIVDLKAAAGDKPKHYNEANEDSFRDIIFTQLCCVLWILEQMYHLTHPEITSKWRPISASWELSGDDSSSPMKLKKPKEQQNLTNKIWYQFIKDTSSSRQTKIRFRNQRPSSVRSLSSLQSTTLSEQRSTTPSSSIMKTQSTRRTSKSGLKNLTEQSSNPISNLRKNSNNSSIIVNNSNQTISENNLNNINNNNNNNNNNVTVTDTTPTMNRKDVRFSEISNTSKQNRNSITQWVDYTKEIRKMSRESLTELAHEIEVDLDKESMRETELRMITRGRMTSKSGAKPIITQESFQQDQMKELPKEFTSSKLTNLVDNIRKQLAIMVDENAVELQDRLQYMKQIKPEMCLAKYHNIPVKSHKPTTIQSLLKLAHYDKLTSGGGSAKKSNMKNQLAPWYVDILTDLSDLKSEPKFSSVLSKLKFYAELSPSLFTVITFTRVLCSLTLWEILSPASVAAIDFIRTHIIDMSADEYFDWLYQTYPKIKEFINQNIKI